MAGVDNFREYHTDLGPLKSKIILAYWGLRTMDRQQPALIEMRDREMHVISAVKLLFIAMTMGILYSGAKLMKQLSDALFTSAALELVCRTVRLSTQRNPRRPVGFKTAGRSSI